MLKENYIAKRTELMEEAQNFINEGNFEAFEAKKIEVEKLDADFDVACQKQAELDVLNSNNKVTKIEIYHFNSNIQLKISYNKHFIKQ